MINEKVKTWHHLRYGEVQGVITADLDEWVTLRVQNSIKTESITYKPGDEFTCRKENLKPQKIITYVLMIASTFPKHHIRNMQPTEFSGKIQTKEKIHTIRSNYEIWNKRMKKVLTGEAEISLRIWQGRPYHSKQQEILRLNKDHGVGVERLTFKFAYFDRMVVNEKECSTDIKKSIARNDGLSYLDFESWFHTYDRTKALAIIHFTPFRYGD